MAFASLDAAAVSRALASLPAGPDDLVDAYFERLETVELPADGEPPGVRVWREEGLAIRHLEAGRSRLASRDELSVDAFHDALRQAARVHPSATPAMSAQALVVEPATAPAPPAALTSFPSRLARALRGRRLGFPLRVTVRHHRRWRQVVGPRLVAAPAVESFDSCRLELPGGGLGALLADLEQEAVEELAERLADRFQARQLAPVGPLACPVLLGSAAAAVFLHEAVAHALEADTVAASGRPEAALGLALGGPGLDVLDDPAAAPPGIARDSDDEGTPVIRRWLLRGGVVEQLLADRDWARRVPALAPGAARRADRHQRPVPRSSYLVLLPAADAAPSLVGELDEGILVPEVERGRLDAVSGFFSLRFAYARRVQGGKVTGYLGPGVLEGRVAELLARIVAVGGKARAGGAGWCAKGGHRLPVWASAPEIVLAPPGTASAGRPLDEPAGRPGEPA